MFQVRRVRWLSWPTALPERGVPTDLVAQHLAQQIFDIQPRVGFQQAAHAAVPTAQLMWPGWMEDLPLGSEYQASLRRLRGYL